MKRSYYEMAFLSAPAYSKQTNTLVAVDVESDEATHMHTQL